MQIHMEGENCTAKRVSKEVDINITLVGQLSAKAAQ
jgi:hypothetical protein